VIDDALLRVLTAHTGREQTFKDRPVPIAGGFWAAIFGFELAEPSEEMHGPLVLRVMPNPQVGEVETIVQREVALLGYPTPRVVFDGFDEGLGGAFMVMERVDGVHLLSGIRIGGALLGLPKIIRRIARQLSMASVQLHDLDPKPIVEALAVEGVDVSKLGPQSRLRDVHVAADATRCGLDKVLEWLEQRQPSFEPHVVCHGDIHPYNMLVTPDGSFNVLDWTNATLCRREYDLGCTAALLQCAPVEVPRIAQRPLRGVTGSVARRFVDAYRASSASHAPINLDVVEWFETLQYARCLASVVVSPIDDPIIGPKHPFRIAGPAMVRQVEMITGVAVELPRVDHG
jgi:aminoglycoside phosphotransferase (APT) family kinase protein